MVVLSGCTTMLYRVSGVNCPSPSQKKLMMGKLAGSYTGEESSTRVPLQTVVSTGKILRSCGRLSTCINTDSWRIHPGTVAVTVYKVDSSGWATALWPLGPSCRPVSGDQFSVPPGGVSVTWISAVVPRQMRRLSGTFSDRFRLTTATCTDLFTVQPGLVADIW